MKILHIVLTHRPIGGMEIYGRHVTAALHQLGHRVTVWSYLESGSSDCWIVPVYGLMPKARLVQSLYVRFLGNWMLAACLARQAGAFDLVIAGHPMAVPGVYLANRLRPRLRYWVWTHGSDIWSDWSHWLRAGLSRSELILTVSDHTRGSIQRRLPKADIRIVPNAVDVSHFRPSEEPTRPSTEPMLLTVSRLGTSDAYKGHDTVIQALPLVQQRLGRPVTYWIVGRGDGVERLRTMAEELGVADRLRFWGRVDDDRLIGLYQACDLFVMPSRVQYGSSDQWKGEGFGRVYIEAAACGKPVVGSNQGGAAEALVHGTTGFAVDPHSVGQVADAIYALLSNPGLAARMGQAGRRFVKENFARKVFERRIADLVTDWQTQTMTG